MTVLALRPDRHLRKAILWTAILTATVPGLRGPAAASAVGAECSPGPRSGLGNEPWLVPCALPATTTQESFYEFMWQTFVALNWPAVGRGEPDPQRGLSDNQPLQLRVWETYPGPLEVFLPPDQFAGYPTWEELGAPFNVDLAFHKIPPPFAIVVNQPGLSNLSLTGEDDFATGPLVDQNHRYVRYQVGINRSYFEYLRRYEYYNRQRQIEAVNVSLEACAPDRANPAKLDCEGPPPEAFQPLPTGREGYLRKLPAYARHGMVEIKAAWRVLDGVRHPERYIRSNVCVDVIDTEVVRSDLEPSCELMGLVALHILRYTPSACPGQPPRRIATTFEQVDNVALPPGAPKGLTPSFNDGTPPGPVEGLLGFRSPSEGTPGRIPAPICTSKEKCGAAFNPPVDKPDPTPVYRAVPVPAEVEAVNARFQAEPLVARSPLKYYKMIGTQNKHQGEVVLAPGHTAECLADCPQECREGCPGRECPSSCLEDCPQPTTATNGHEGPITGVYSNTNNLINTALESYTQRNVSCIQCHVAARPWGVTQASFGIDEFKILSFLMRRAQCLPEGWACTSNAACCSGNCAPTLLPERGLSACRPGSPGGVGH